MPSGDATAAGGFRDEPNLDRPGAGSCRGKAGAHQPDHLGAGKGSAEQIQCMETAGEGWRAELRKICKAEVGLMHLQD